MSEKEAIAAIRESSPQSIRRKVAITPLNQKRLDILRALHSDELDGFSKAEEVEYMINIAIERYYKSSEVQECFSKL